MLTQAKVILYSVSVARYLPDVMPDPNPLPSLFDAMSAFY